MSYISYGIQNYSLMPHLKKRSFSVFVKCPETGYNRRYFAGLVWSGPPSFVSSSGPSSPNGMSDIFSSRGGGGTTGTSESSEMSLSASLISNDGYVKSVATLSYKVVFMLQMCI